MVVTKISLRRNKKQSRTSHDLQLKECSYRKQKIRHKNVYKCAYGKPLSHKNQNHSAIVLRLLRRPTGLKKIYKTLKINSTINYKTKHSRQIAGK